MTTASDERAPEVLDLRGLKCPLPALFARRMLARAADGTCITVVADDPLAGVDIPHMCHQENFEVVALEQSGSEWRLTIRKSARVPG
jgi:tRNA 2-thiouridine synthesizing protein A